MSGLKHVKADTAGMARFRKVILDWLENGYPIKCWTCGKETVTEFWAGSELPDGWRIVITYWINKENGANLSHQFETTTTDQPIFCCDTCQRIWEVNRFPGIKPAGDS